MSDVRRSFLDSLEVVRPLLAAEETALVWERASALREMTVGELVGHLLRAVTGANTYLEQPPPREPPITAPEYYAKILTTSDIADPFHVGIRKRAQVASTRGPANLLSDWDEGVAALSERIRSEPEERTLTVAGDLVMYLDDYLVTRLVEVVVHADDLAMSVGLDTPTFDPRAMVLVFHHLVDVARQRHGDLAVLRAFTRRERDDLQALLIF